MSTIKRIFWTLVGYSIWFHIQMWRVVFTIMFQVRNGRPPNETEVYDALTRWGQGKDIW